MSANRLYLLTGGPTVHCGHDCSLEPWALKVKRVFLLWGEGAVLPVTTSRKCHGWLGVRKKWIALNKKCLNLFLRFLLTVGSGEGSQGNRKGTENCAEDRSSRRADSSLHCTARPGVLTVTQDSRSRVSQRAEKMWRHTWELTPLPLMTCSFKGGKSLEATLDSIIFALIQYILWLMVSMWLSCVK